MLNKRGIKVKKTNIHSIFTFVQSNVLGFQKRAINLDNWEKVGIQLKTYYTQHGPEKVPTDAFSLWNIIRDVLDPAPESGKVHVKEESEEKKTHVKEEDEEKEAMPTYWQLN